MSDDQQLLDAFGRPLRRQADPFWGSQTSMGVRCICDRTDDRASADPEVRRTQYELERYCGVHSRWTMPRGSGQTAIWPVPYHTAAWLPPPYPTETRIVEVPVYIERPAPMPPARVYPPFQGLTRPYHCTEPAGPHPGYMKVTA